MPMTLEKAHEEWPEAEKLIRFLIRYDTGGAREGREWAFAPSRQELVAYANTKGVTITHMRLKGVWEVAEDGTWRKAGWRGNTPRKIPMVPTPKIPQLTREGVEVKGEQAKESAAKQFAGSFAAAMDVIARPGTEEDFGVSNEQIRRGLG